MPKNNSNKKIDGFSGKYLKSHYLQIRGDRQYLKKNPDRAGHKKKPDEEKNQLRFKDANIYARMVAHDPASKAFYTPFRELLKQSEYVMAITDGMVPPIIESIDQNGYTGLAGQNLMVIATDNFQVMEVVFTILDSNGIPLETGKAMPTEKENQWSYIAQKDILSLSGNQVQVEAFDRPGNRTVALLLLDEPVKL
ncbi:hypothetical protein [Flavihumibacter sp.]|uniref:hypothetical protein n=1 Tax=Flavihumibacter sp. TaxID=1913981 RepID=UPI002FCA305C